MTARTTNLGGTDWVTATTTLSEEVDISETSIDLTDASNFSSNGIILVDNELISYTGISTNTLTGCTRGYGNSTATTHSNGTTVYEKEILTSEDLNDTFNAVVTEARNYAKYALDPEANADAVQIDSSGSTSGALPDSGSPLANGVYYSGTGTKQYAAGPVAQATVITTATLNIHFPHPWSAITFVKCTDTSANGDDTNSVGFNFSGTSIGIIPTTSAAGATVHGKTYSLMFIYLGSGVYRVFGGGSGPVDVTTTLPIVQLTARTENSGADGIATCNMDMTDSYYLEVV